MMTALSEVRTETKAGELGSVPHGINFADLEMGLPAIATMVVMLLTFNITNGIGAGFVTYAATGATCTRRYGRWRRCSYCTSCGSHSLVCTSEPPAPGREWQPGCERLSGGPVQTRPTVSLTRLSVEAVSGKTDKCPDGYRRGGIAGTPTSAPAASRSPPFTPSGGVKRAVSAMTYLV